MTRHNPDPEMRMTGPFLFPLARTVAWRSFLTAWLLSTFFVPVDAAEDRWVHGSWVNLRAEPNAKAKVMTRLTANTRVAVLADGGEWCKVAAEAASTKGFMTCKLLGRQPLQLAEVESETRDGAPNPQYSPTRAFWISPSVGRLGVAGGYFWTTMLSARQRAREVHRDGEEAEGAQLFTQETAPEIVRFPIPEFDAMKALMRKGVVEPPERRPVPIRLSELTGSVRPNSSQSGTIVSGIWFDDGAMSLLAQIKPAPPKPSYFKRHEELASRLATVEQISAQFGIKVQMEVLDGPKWVWPRHGGDAYVAGIWDVGSFKLKLEKPVVEYTIGRQGLASAAAWVPVVEDDLASESGCGDDLRYTRHGENPLRGYPVVKDPLAVFYTPSALPFKKVAITKYAKRTISAGQDHSNGLTLIVMYEIDLDADGIADLSVWEGMPRATSEANDLAARLVLANIAGDWFLVEQTSYTECS